MTTKEATIIYPHQLFLDHPAIDKNRPIYLVEEYLILAHNPTHNQKLIFHKLSMDAYQERLEKDDYELIRLTIKDYPSTKSVFERIKKDEVKKIHIVDTTDFLLEKAIQNSGLIRIWYNSPMFVLPKKEACQRYTESKRFMAKFYKTLRQDKQILVQEDGKPTGGQWSFDKENRKKLPKKIDLPNDITLNKKYNQKDINDWLETIKTEKYGEKGCWLPYTHADAQDYYQDFLEKRFQEFGSYEDAITTRGTRLFHSAISPLLNTGLLTPDQALAQAIEYANKNDIPINSLEGFVRQILGWREFIRASYETDQIQMRNTKFWKHNRKLSKQFWTGDTKIEPIDHTIEQALKFGYNHHIERLMVMGNFMLLSQINPDDVYKWFMSMYIDAYDWVMVPNVYGMSQFADGGIFATKPYISGSNYIKKMSDYPSGDWENIWTALYWKFINTHKNYFTSNYRLSMMPKMLEKMNENKRQNYFDIANKFLENSE